MSLGAHAESRAAGIRAAVRELLVQDYRLGLRGKNDSVRPPGIHMSQCMRWRDNENPANPVLQNDPTRVPV